MDANLIISASLVANWATWYFKPFEPAREYIVKRWVDFFVRKNMFWATRAIVIITCPKCLAFWLILICTHNLVGAIVASMLALIIQKILTYAESK